jgi:Zn-dependent peptidase ImmA (M78 family)
VTNSWNAAHRIANIEAARTHARLAIDKSNRIDVFAAAKAMGLWLHGRDLEPQVFGVYLAQTDAPAGILLNAIHDKVTQRHTMAHELGHHVFGHANSVDTNLHELMACPGEAWPEPERHAEAFAAWFLMPRRAVLRAMGRLNIKRPQTPADVYRIALLLGTSYRGTARHLPNLRLASHPQADRWANVPPATLKDQLGRHLPPRTGPRADIWLINQRFNGHRIHPRPGDRLVIQLPVPHDGATWRLTAPSGLHWVAAHSQPELASSDGLANPPRPRPTPRPNRQAGQRCLTRH